jgi:hypothetical protein
LPIYIAIRELINQFFGLRKGGNMTSREYDIVEPLAESMIHSLRAFGYDLRTAIADLIDNSLTAGADNIWVMLEWNGSKTCIYILDDGRGMLEDQLVSAMRLGSMNPLHERDPRDLGRFGLGLKTASFSQCRKFTVFTKTKKDTSPNTRIWDLDYVSRTKQWRLLKRAGKEIQPYLAKVSGMQQGTMVLWEQIDRITEGTKVNSKKDHEHFLEEIDAVRKHIAMIFHHFMDQPKPKKFWVNDRKVEPWDPFLEKNTACQVLSPEIITINQKEINVQPFVLPHHSKLSRSEYEAAGGTRGWNAQQGFYVYRNKRMLVDGDWLSLGLLKEEHYKLARIRIDLPNDLDIEWDIDVKKSKARPPAGIRQDLKRIARITRERAGGIYRHRGKVMARKNTAEYVYPWKQLDRRGKMFYNINREHPLVQEVLESAGENRKNITALLRMLEETVPVALITINNSEKPDQHGRPFEGRPTKEMMDVLAALYESLIHSGCTKEEAQLRLSVMEPFDLYPETVAAFIERQEAK